jgi:cytochrome c553
MAYIYVRHSFAYRDKVRPGTGREAGLGHAGSDENREMECSAMQSIAAVIMVGILVGGSGAVHAGDVAAGKIKSATCAGCHGAAGISKNPLWPNLAGQQQGYLVKQLKAFRDGSRTDPMMTPMAQPLSDDDIANLAAWYNSL